MLSLSVVPSFFLFFLRHSPPSSLRLRRSPSPLRISFFATPTRDPHCPTLSPSQSPRRDPTALTQPSRRSHPPSLLAATSPLSLRRDLIPSLLSLTIVISRQRRSLSRSQRLIFARDSSVTKSLSRSLLFLRRDLLSTAVLFSLPPLLSLLRSATTEPSRASQHSAVAPQATHDGLRSVVGSTRYRR